MTLAQLVMLCEVENPPPSRRASNDVRELAALAEMPVL